MGLYVVYAVIKNSPAQPIFCIGLMKLQDLQTLKYSKNLN